jgi:hypothetical protein
MLVAFGARVGAGRVVGRGVGFVGCVAACGRVVGVAWASCFGLIHHIVQSSHPRHIPYVARVVCCFTWFPLGRDCVFVSRPLSCCACLYSHILHKERMLS